MIDSKRHWLEQRFGEIKALRSQHENEHREILEQLNPNRGRWSDSDRNRAKPREKLHISSVPMRSRRIFAAGMTASMTSPSRVWFRFTTSDPSVTERHEVRTYMAATERIVRELLAKSRYYQFLAGGIYPDLAAIATGVGLAEPARGFGMVFRCFAPGLYWIDVDAEGSVDTLFVQRQWTCRQLVGEFGLEACSPAIRNAWERGNYSTPATVVRAIYPNREFQPGRLDRHGKPWASDWWEVGFDHGWLRQGGFEENPIIAPRWSAGDGEAYGKDSPGWESKGDCRQLQHLEKQLITMVDKVADPPLKSSSRGDRASLVPGDTTYVAGGAQGILEPLHEIEHGALTAVERQMQRPELRIEQAFFVDLWLSILRDERNSRPTATEILEQRQEVMLQLGPLLDILNDELLEPSVMRAFAIAERQGLLPEPPEELQGQQVNIEFISILHQAQKMTGLSGIRELIANIMTLAQAGKVEALDKIDADAIVDEIGDMLGVKPEIVLSGDKVDAIRQAKAERQQAQDQGQAMLAATEGVRNVAGADPGNLQDLAAMVAPVAAARSGLNQGGGL